MTVEPEQQTALEPRKGEAAVKLMSEDKQRYGCLRVPQGAMKGTEADRYFRLRAGGDQVVVRGHRCGDVPTETTLRACSALVEKVTGTKSADQLEVFIAPARWWNYLPEVGPLSWVRVLVALLAFAAVVTGLLATVIDSEAPSPVLFVALGVGVVAAGATLVTDAINALTIRCD